MALDFPNSPVDGQVYDNFYYDAVKGTWKSLSSGASPSILENPTITNPTITDALITITANTPSTVPITINGAASQSANLQEWKNSSGIVLADIDNVGSLQAPKLGLGGAVPPTSPSSTHLQVNGRAKILSNGSESAGIWLTGSNNIDTAFIGQFSPTTTDPVGIYHNGDWRFLVDSLGRVRMPYQPSVLAFRPSGNNFSQGTGVLPFGSVKHNTGNHYNTSNYRFTAPVSGVYALTIHFNTYGNSGVIVQPSFLINGSSLYGGNRISKNITGDLDVTGAVSVYLNANDYVQPYVNLSSSQSFSSSEFWTHFSVHFVG
jgi:hypothetical protein